MALNAAKRHADSAPTATFTPVYQSSDADLKASSEATTRVGSSTPVESNDVSEEPTREVVGETSIEADGGSIGDTSAGETEGGKRKRERNDNASTKSASREDEVSVTSKAFTTGRGSHEGGHVGHDDGDDDDDGVDWEEGGGIEDGGDGDGALRADREAPKNNDRGEGKGPSLSCVTVLALVKSGTGFANRRLAGFFAPAVAAAASPVPAFPGTQ